VWQVSNQMIISCKRFIEEDASGGDVIWTRPLIVVEARLNDCLQLRAEYQAQCRRLRTHFGDTRELSHVIMCGKFDKFADRLRKIVEMIAVLQTYRALRGSRIEGDWLALR